MNCTAMGPDVGAIYNDGNTMTLRFQGTKIEQHSVATHGPAIFFVTNNLSGDSIIDGCTIQNNIGGTSYQVYPGISMHAETPSR